MTLRRLPWLAAALVLLAACSGGPPDLVTRPTAPAGGAPPRRGAASSPTVPGAPPSPWGAVPVVAPAGLRAAANAYYAGGGPDPDDPVLGAPACLLLLPTSLGPGVAPVPTTSRFDVFGHFVVTWSLARRHATALTLSVVPPGDPTDRPYFGPDATVTTFADGSEVRRTPAAPGAALVRIPIENCEYELEAGPGLAAGVAPATIAALRLVYAP